jgi:TonB family protein
MLLRNDKRRRIETLLLAVVVGAIAFDVRSASQTTPTASSKCVPFPAFTPEPKFPSLKAGEPVKLGAPALELQVADDGTVKAARLIRSSYVKDWDREILKTVKTWRFSRAPGCGSREIKVSIDIHVD